MATILWNAHIVVTVYTALWPPSSGMPIQQSQLMLPYGHHPLECPYSRHSLCCLMATILWNAHIVVTVYAALWPPSSGMPIQQSQLMLPYGHHPLECPYSSHSLCCLMATILWNAHIVVTVYAALWPPSSGMPIQQSQLMLPYGHHPLECPYSSHSLCCLMATILWNAHIVVTAYAALWPPSSRMLIQQSQLMLPYDHHPLECPYSSHSLCCLMATILWNAHIVVTVYAALWPPSSGMPIQQSQLMLPYDHHPLECSYSSHSLCCLMTTILWNVHIVVTVYAALWPPSSGMPIQQSQFMLPYGHHPLECPYSSHSLCCLMATILQNAHIVVTTYAALWPPSSRMPIQQSQFMLPYGHHPLECPYSSHSLCCLMATILQNAHIVVTAYAALWPPSSRMPIQQSPFMLPYGHHPLECPYSSHSLCCLMATILQNAHIVVTAYAALWPPSSRMPIQQSQFMLPYGHHPLECSYSSHSLCCLMATILQNAHIVVTVYAALWPPSSGMPIQQSQFMLPYGHHPLECPYSSHSLCCLMTTILQNAHIVVTVYAALWPPSSRMPIQQSQLMLPYGHHTLECPYSSHSLCCIMATILQNAHIVVTAYAAL